MNDQDSPKTKYTSDNWDEIRLSFSTSLMVDTNLVSLSQNSEMAEWPIKGNGETPSKYIDFTYEELLEMPGLADKPERIDLLIDILKETMDFDDPFGDMVSTVDAAARKDDTIGKSLSQLGIPKDFPIQLAWLSDDTRSFCKNEEIKDIESFTRFSQNMAESVVTGGDFRALLNAFSHLDEKTIAEYLPFRVKHTGLHLPEGVALVLKDLSKNEKNALLQRYGRKLTDEELSGVNYTKEQMNQLESIILSRVGQQVDYFRSQFDELSENMRKGVSLDRFFMVLDNPDVEFIASRIMVKFFNSGNFMGQVQVKASNAKSNKKPGFFARLFGRK